MSAIQYPSQPIRILSIDERVALATYLTNKYTPGQSMQDMYEVFEEALKDAHYMGDQSDEGVETAYVSLIDHLSSVVYGFAGLTQKVA